MKLLMLLAAGFWLLAGQPGAVDAQPTDSRDWIRAIEQNDAVRLGLLFGRRQKAGLPTDVRNPKGKTALMAAAAAGNIEVFKLLVAGGADPGATNIKGASTLMYAAWRGDPEIVAELLARQVPLNQAASNGWTAMTMAAAKGNARAIRLLIDAGAMVDSRDVYAWTPLMRASNLGRLEAARLLVRHGAAELGLINTSGQTALHLAAAAGHRELYQLLVRAGADPSQADFRGKTPAQMIATHP
ncbi:MAG: ankyrin repeat domain-containing protein [Burkholderiaceae bacterium]